MQNKAQLDKPFVCAGNMVLFHIEKIPLTIINTDKSHVPAVMCAMLVNLTDIWSHASKSIGQLSPWLYTLLDVTWLWKKRILWFWPQQRNVCHTYIHWRYCLFGNLSWSSLGNKAAKRRYFGVMTCCSPVIPCLNMSHMTISWPPYPAHRGAMRRAHPG